MSVAGARGDMRRQSTAWMAQCTKQEWAELAEERLQEIERLRSENQALKDEIASMRLAQRDRAQRR